MPQMNFLFTSCSRTLTGNTHTVEVVDSTPLQALAVEPASLPALRTFSNRLIGAQNDGGETLKCYVTSVTPSVA